MRPERNHYRITLGVCVLAGLLPTSAHSFLSESGLSGSDDFQDFFFIFYPTNPLILQIQIQTIFSFNLTQGFNPPKYLGHGSATRLAGGQAPAPAQERCHLFVVAP